MNEHITQCIWIDLAACILSFHPVEGFYKECYDSAQDKLERAQALILEGYRIM